jgi:hypothetical protein
MRSGRESHDITHRRRRDGISTVATQRGVGGVRRSGDSVSERGKDDRGTGGTKTVNVRHG